MEEKMKSKVLWVLTLAVVLGFGGCAKKTAENNYMRLTWWGNTVRDERTLKVINLYQSKNPGVTIDTETTGWGTYWDKVNTQAASGSMADLMQQDFSYIGQWAGRNQLADLTPYTEDGTIDVSHISEAALSSGRLNGKLYGISMGTNAFGIAYDPAVLAKAGIPAIDSKNWTLKDFERIATTIYEKTGVQTIPFGGTTDPRPILENLIRQTGDSLFSADGKALGFTDTTVLEEFMNLQLRLLAKNVLVPIDEAFIQVSIEEDPFSRGKSWIQFIWSNQFTATANGAARPIDLMFVPRIEQFQRPGTFLKPSQFFSITAKAANPVLAAKVFNFFLNDIEANDILMAERGIPIPDDVRDHLYTKVDDNMKVSFAFVTAATEYSSLIDPPDPAAAGEVGNVLRDIEVQILNKTISTEEGVSRFMTRANKILSGE
jgi:multiple sugar transport system substrate-binding protein